MNKHSYLIVKEGEFYKRRKEVTEMPAKPEDENGRAYLPLPKFIESIKQYSEEDMVAFIITHYLSHEGKLYFDDSAKEIVPLAKERLKSALDKNKAKIKTEPSEKLEEKIKRIEAGLSSLG